MLIFLSVDAQAADVVISGECGENVTFVLDNEGVLTISGEGPMENYQIYSFSDFKYSPWMEHKDSVVRIVVEEGITSVGDYAFQYHSNVTDISLPESLTRIGAGAFMSCENLPSIYIAPKVEFIGKLAFDATYKLKDVYIKDLDAWFGIEFQLGTLGDATSNPLYFADNLYLNGEPVTEVVVPEDVTVLHNAVLSIASLEQVVLHDGVVKIENYVFYQCPNLKEIHLPYGLTSIGAWSFGQCYNLQEITLPDSVSYIGDSAFAFCDSLTEIIIPAGVTKLGKNVFYSCDELVSVTVSETLMSIDENAFTSCHKLKDVYYYGTEEQWGNLKSNTAPSNIEFLSAAVHIKDQPLIVLSDIPSMNIEIGDTITLSAGVRIDQTTFDNAKGITYQLADGSNLDVVNSGTEDGLFFVEFRGTYEGTTYVTFHDSISGQKVTVAITVSENSYYTYNVADVPEQYIEEFPTNIYNFNGLYIDNYQYKVKSYEDPVTGAKNYMDAHVTFDAYNANYTYAIAEIYNYSGELINAVLINKRKDFNTSIYGVLGEGTAAFVKGIRTGELSTYRNEHNSACTQVELDIPSNGYVKITSDPLESDVLAIVNCVDMFLTIKSLAGELKGQDYYDFLDSDFAEVFTEKLIADTSLAHLKKDGAKVFEKLFIDMGKELVITPKTVGGFADTLSKQLTEADLMDVVKDSLLASGIDMGENIFIEMFGLAGDAMETIFMLSKVSTVALTYNDLAMSTQSGAVRISNQGGGSRSAMGVQVRATETYDTFVSNVVLQTYKVELDEDLLTLVKNADEESYELLTSGISHTYEISLMQNGKSVQHDGKVMVYIPIPENIRSLSIQGNVKVYRVEEDGTLTDMDAVVEDDSIVFTTDHFSLYTVVGYESKETVDSSAVDVNSEKDDSDAQSTPDDPHDDITNKTKEGPPAITVILVAVLVLAVCGILIVFVIKKRTK